MFTKQKLFFLTFLSLLFGFLLFPNSSVKAVACLYEFQDQTQCFLYPTQESQERKVTIDVTELKKQLDPLTKNLNNIQPTDLRAFCLAICEQQGTNCRLDESKVDCAPGQGAPESYQGPLPDCAFSRTGCRSVDSFVVLAINIGKIIFSFLGSIAFVMFIYGGVVMVASFGNPEKFKQGQQILGAAVIGVIIALSAYLAVDFVLDTLGVQDSFRGVNL